jgi:hypothetical protein
MSSLCPLVMVKLMREIARRDQFVAICLGGGFGLLYGVAIMMGVR